MKTIAEIDEKIRCSIVSKIHNWLLGYNLSVDILIWYSIMVGLAFIVCIFTNV